MLTTVLATSAANAACTVSVTQNVSFGSYNPFSLTDTSATGTINVSCSGLVGIYAYQVDLNQGSYGTFSGRKMANGTNRITYNLYTDAAYTLVWGNGTSGTSIRSGNCIIVLSTCSNNLTVYGKLPAQQNVAVGGYADSVTVTLNY